MSNLSTLQTTGPLEQKRRRSNCSLGAGIGLAAAYDRGNRYLSKWITFSDTITKLQYVVRFTERWGAVVVLSFSNAYNSVRTHESMHLVGCYLLIGFHWQSKIRKGA